MSDSKGLVRRYIRAFNDHDIEACAALVADDLVNHGAIPEAQGAKGARTILAKLFKAMPDMSCTCEDMIAEGDRVVARLTMRGTHTGPLEFVRLPVAATGKASTTDAIHIYRVANGKIAEQWIGRDDIGMLRQLGLLGQLAKAS